MSQLDLLSPTSPVPSAFRPSVFNQGDAFEWLRAIPPGVADLFTTDPPYASLELHRAKGTTTRLKKSDGSSNEWFGVVPDERLPELIDHAYRILKNDRHFWLFCDEATETVIKFQQFLLNEHALPRRNSDGSFPTKSGFKYWKSAIWVKTTLDGEKPRAGMGYHLRGAAERIMFFEKGRRKLADLGMPDVFCGPALRTGYPTAKDIDVVKALVAQSTIEGELVIDPFMGGWTTAEAALSQGRRVAGNDIADLSLATGKARLAQWLGPAEAQWPLPTPEIAALPPRPEIA